jgi:hypothetical protein
MQNEDNTVEVLKLPGDPADLPHHWMDHYLEAERLLVLGSDNHVAKAQVHAQLASILVGANKGPTVAHVQGPFLTRAEAMRARAKMYNG